MEASVSTAPRVRARPKRYPESARIWIIDDEENAALYAPRLAACGYAVEQHDFKAALRLLSANAPGPRLVILELLQREISGLVLCAKLRARTAAPIVVYSATRRAAEREICHSLGATRFVSKRAPLATLMESIDEALATGNSPRDAISRPGEGLPRAGGLVFDTAQFRVRLNDIALDLTPIEHRILLRLAAARGNLVTYSELITSVWGSAAPTSRATLQRHIQRVRAILRQAAPDAPNIVSFRGRGYGLTSTSSSRLGTYELPQDAA